jgi:transposase, IS5 family
MNAAFGGGTGYQGIEKREEHKDRKVDWFIAMRPGKRKQLCEHSDEAEVETLKAQVRATVEHPFRYIKRVFGYDKVRYRGLAKNTERLHVLAAFSNLMIGKKYLLA